MSMNYPTKSVSDRKLANAAKRAGLVLAPARKGQGTHKRSKILKEQHGSSKDIMLMGSTGFRTFTDPTAEFHEVIKNCRGAKIMLLNPSSNAACIRATSILDKSVTVARFRRQIRKSIEFIESLNRVHPNVRLKLYDDVPFLKLTILGDYIWVQHYHAGLDVKNMPEYVFKHGRQSRGFYSFFYQYFFSRWNDPGIIEYDFGVETPLH